MIVFYQDKNNVANVVSIELEKKVSACTTSCVSNCIKPKSKCCNKYQKKGINCKRCPLVSDFKAVS